MLDLQMDGRLLKRGFWLYIIELTRKDGTVLLYSGRTGDYSSGASQSVFNRLSRHLGFNSNDNSLRQNLGDIDPADCRIHLFASGPFELGGSHTQNCNTMAALERKLTESLSAAGHTVINTVNSKQPIDEALWARVQDDFAAFLTGD